MGRSRTRAMLALAVVGCTAVVAVLAAGTPGPASDRGIVRGGSAHAGAAAAAAATASPVSPLASTGLRNYVVVAAPHRPVSVAVSAIKRVGGNVTVQWPQIGVVLAQSDDPTFAVDVMRAGGNTLDAAGPTRTVAPAEGLGDRQAQAASSPDVPPTTAPTTPTARGDTTPSTSVSGDQNGWDFAAIHADTAHATTEGSRRVVVGVLDSGIDDTHPDLYAAFDAADSVDCTDNGIPDTTPGRWRPTSASHGTHVAGTIAAADDGRGITGVAPGVRIASVKVVNDSGMIYPEYAICGFLWAGAHHFAVTNNSYFIDPWLYWCESVPDQTAVVLAVQRAVSWANGQGSLTVAAAGNSGDDLDGLRFDATSPDDSTASSRDVGGGFCRALPAMLPGVVTVSATDSAGRLADFSNDGYDWVDLAAPGVDIRSTLPGDTYGLDSGTSMAAPHVTGVAALIASQHPGWSPVAITERLRATATPMACYRSSAVSVRTCRAGPHRTSFFGAGLVNAAAAVAR